MTHKGILVAALLGLTQLGFNMYMTNDGKRPVRWYREDVPVVLDSRGTPDLPFASVEAEVRGACGTWNAVDFCRHPVLTDGGVASGLEPGDPEAGGTSKNLVIFENADQWVAHGHGGEDRVVALTTLYYEPSSGKIHKFDMEFADFQFRFTTTDNPDQVGTDLRNTATHEFGHVLGLDHSTYVAATMYPTAPEGELSKRTLAADDMAGLCAVYANWSPEEADQGCAAGKANASPAVLLLALGLVMALRRRSCA